MHNFIAMCIMENVGCNAKQHQHWRKWNDKTTKLELELDMALGTNLLCFLFSCWCWCVFLVGLKQFDTSLNESALNWPNKSSYLLNIRLENATLKMLQICRSSEVFLTHTHKHARKHSHTQARTPWCLICFASNTSHHNTKPSCWLNIKCFRDKCTGY